MPDETRQALPDQIGSPGGGRAQWNEARERIMQGAVRLTMGVNAAESQCGRAVDAGAALAAEVYRFTEDPDGVGLDALKDAYSVFMAQHAGNFAPPMEGH